MTIRDIHLDNLKILIRRFGSLDKLLDAVVEAGAAPVSKKYIQQVQSGWQGEQHNRPRDFGPNVCRRLEKAAGEPVGWMDVAHAPDTAQEAEGLRQSGLPAWPPIRSGKNQMRAPWAFIVGGAATIPESNVDASRPTAPEKMLHIPVLNIEGSLGSGREAPNHEVVASQISVSEPWLRRNLVFSAPGNLSIITGSGDSMKPTFSDGDLLLVDRGITEVKVDAVYVSELYNKIYIKRLQLRPDGAILMISDNKAYEPYVILAKDLEAIHIRGRVLLAWNANKL
ncbi:MAG: S24 family peptidase [Sulfuriferula sp.]